MADDIKRFTFSIPSEPHTRLKIKCMLDGVHMGDVMKALVEKEVADTPTYKKLRKGRQKAAAEAA
jgi:hypothetical protein